MAQSEIQFRIADLRARNQALQEKQANREAGTTQESDIRSRITELRARNQALQETRAQKVQGALKGNVQSALSGQLHPLELLQRTGAAIPQTPVPVAAETSGQIAARQEELNRQIESKDLDAVMEELSILNNGTGRYSEEGQARIAQLEAQVQEIRELRSQADALAAQYYNAKNQEQIASLGTNRSAAQAYTSAQEVRSDRKTVADLMAALSAGENGTQVRQAQAYLMEKYGLDESTVNSWQDVNWADQRAGTEGEGYRTLPQLYAALEEQQEQAASELKTGGYDYSRMAGYEQMLEDAREYQRKQARWEQQAKEDPVGASIASVLAAPMQGAEYLLTMAGGVGHSDPDDLENYVPMNVYNMDVTNMVSTVRGTVAREIEEHTDWEIFGQNVASFLYQTGMSVADSAVQVGTMGKWAALLMGTSAASNQAKNIIERGGTNSQAFWGGLAAGAAETLFEKVSIDRLLSEKSVTGVKSLLKETAKQAGTEASEEVFTEIANILSDAVILGNNSEFANTVQQYMSRGMTREQAEERAFLDCVAQVAWAGVGGALSGMAMGGTVNTMNYAGNRGASAQDAAPQGVGGILLPTAAQGTTLPRPGQQNPASTGEAEQLISDSNMVRYKAAIDHVFTGELESGSDIVVGETPSILRQYGAPDLNLHISQSTVRKIVYPEGYMGGKHNLGMSAMKNLPYQIADPVAILKSKSQPNSLVEITAWKTQDGQDVIVPIHLNKQGAIEAGNSIASAYGTSHIDTILGENNENVLYTKNNEDIHQLLSNGLQLPEAMADDVLARNIIPQNDDSVNPRSTPAGVQILLPTAAQGTTLPRPGQQNTASTGEAGQYRAEIPQNVELPTVPIINLSMRSVAEMNNGVLPQTGNVLRKDAISRARSRLGLDQNSEVYIPASNVLRNGEEYVLKITRSSLNKMLSPSNGGIVSPESIVVLENIERIANNGVYFQSEGDRQGRDQIAGYDHLMTTVYIDNQPYSVDMRVRLVQQTPNSETANVLYYFTPEEIVSVEKIDANLPTGKRRALTMSQEMASISDPTVPQTAQGVNPQSAPAGVQILLPTAAQGTMLPRPGQQAARERGAEQTQSLQVPRSDDTMGTVRNFSREGSTYAEEGKAENRREFLERSLRGVRKTGETGGIAYAYVPVGPFDTSLTAEETAKELTALGIESFFHDGLEWNEDGKTYVEIGHATTFGDQIVGIRKDAFGNAKEFAGHEAFHVWFYAKKVADYLAVFDENADKLSLFAVKQAVEIANSYPAAILTNKVWFAEEFYARVSGKIHTGEYDTELRTMFRDYDAVKAAWERLIQENGQSGRGNGMSGQILLPTAEQGTTLPRPGQQAAANPAVPWSLAPGQVLLPTAEQGTMLPRGRDAYRTGEADVQARNADGGSAQDQAEAQTLTGGRANETPAGAEVYIRNSGQRTGSEDPGGELRGVEQGAGQDTRGELESASADLGAAALTYGAEVTTASLGIRNGSESDSIRVVTGGDTESTRAAKALAEEQGLQLVLFGGGDLSIRQADGSTASVRGYVSGGRVFIRADHPVYTAAQLMRHEAGHDRIAKGEIDPDTVRRRVAEEIGAEDLQRLAGMYESAYRGSGLSPDEVWEEIICDSLGDMNVFSGTLDESLVQKLLDETKREAAAEAETGRPRGPPAAADMSTDGKMSRENGYKKVSQQTWRQIQRERMSRYGSHFDTMPHMDAFHAHDMLFVVENFSETGFGVVEAIDPAKHQAKANIVWEVMKDGDIGSVTSYRRRVEALRSQRGRYAGNSLLAQNTGARGSDAELYDGSGTSARADKIAGESGRTEHVETNTKKR